MTIKSTKGASEASSAEIGLVAGWSYPASVFDPLRQCLDGRRVLAHDWSAFAAEWLEGAADLPGSSEPGLSEPGPSVWLGWSLGGALLLEALRRGRIQPERLILVSATPRFLAAPGWPGVSEVAWRDLRRAATRQPVAAVAAFRRRFGLPAADGTHSELASVDGLDWLAQLDLRETLVDVSVPVELWLSIDDPLVPFDWPSHLSLPPQVSRHVLAAPGHAAWYQEPAALARRLLAGIQSI
ncbi:MAG: hypothetical protein WCY71_06445 [Halothiobacillaceae bacterium]